jgi:hypothetical protein
MRFTWLLRLQGYQGHVVLNTKGCIGRVEHPCQVEDLKPGWAGSTVGKPTNWSMISLRERYSSWHLIFSIVFLVSSFVRCGIDLFCPEYWLIRQLKYQRLVHLLIYIPCDDVCKTAVLGPSWTLIWLCSSTRLAWTISSLQLQPCRRETCPLRSILSFWVYMLGETPIYIPILTICKCM